MNTPTYKEQFDKITTAYINDDLRPFNTCACFIGNLLNGEAQWTLGQYYWPKKIRNTHNDLASSCIMIQSNGFYTLNEIYKLENNFLKKIGVKIPIFFWQKGHGVVAGKFSEDQLFEAMVSTLEKLRLLHESKGERPEIIHLQKRQTTNAITK